MHNNLILFRFLIREISGANCADENYYAAIYAGGRYEGYAINMAGKM
jgi:hypothetical protein